MTITKKIGTFSLLAIGIFPVSAFAQQQLTAKNQNIPYAGSASGEIFHWANSRLAGCNVCRGAGSLVLYADDPQGNRDFVRLDVPGADYTAVYDYAPGPDGSIAAVGIAMSGDSRMGTFLAWISADRSRQVITRVWPYGPHVVTVAPDGTIWTVGSVGNENYRTVYPNVLRHYSTSGQLLASTLVSRNRKNQGGSYNVYQTSALMVSNDRIGWMTNACQYIEFSTDAVELGRYNCPNSSSNIHTLGGVALSAAGDLIINEMTAPGPLSAFVLNRSTDSWAPIRVLQDSGNTIRILGFDGLDLVTRTSTQIRRYALSVGPANSDQ